jgi:heterodisulfide reductase subunit A-like polyferredoxin
MHIFSISLCSELKITFHYFTHHPLSSSVSMHTRTALSHVAVALVPTSSRHMATQQARRSMTARSALDMKYSVAVVGGGPSGASAAEIFAQDKTVVTYMIERKMDNCKPCGGAIPLCMVR